MRPVTVALISLAFPLLASADPVKFTIHSMGMSRVSFSSEAMLETIIGNTSHVTGSLEVDLAAPNRGARGQVEVDIGSLKTGIDLRDEHLRGEQWLDAKKFPKATFALDKVSLKGALVAGKRVSGTLSGTLTIHGVAKPVTVPVEVGFHKWSPELKNFGVETDLIRVKAAFKVALSDFGIKVPEMLGKKVAETLEIGLNLTATQAK